jgi:hypothetical protein
MSDNLLVQQGLAGDPKMRTTESPATAGAHMQAVLAGEMRQKHDGIQNLTLTGSAQTLTVPSGATHALIYCEGVGGTDIGRYYHGSAPTASVGKRITGDQEIPSAEPGVAQFITESGAPILRIEYYHYE